MKTPALDNIPKTNVGALLQTLDEHTLYEIEVAWAPNNVIHKAFLFNGFTSGSYTVIYTNNYEHPNKAVDAYYLKIGKKLATLKDSFA